MNEMNYQQTNRGSSPETRVPPRAVDAEEAIIGALLLENKALNLIRDELIPDDFYREEHALIYKAITGLDDRRQAIDLITVIEELKRSGDLERIGGASTIVDLSRQVISSAHIESHVRIVKQKSIARQLIRITAGTYAKCFDESNDIGDILEELDIAFTKLLSTTAMAQSKEMPEMVRQTIEKISKVQCDRENGLAPGVPTHLEALDRSIFGGWSSPDLIVLGGRPSMGKTQHALLIAERAAMNGHHTLFCSIEMTGIQMTTRMFLQEEEINEFHIRNGMMTPGEWIALERRAEELRKIFLHITDDHSIRYLNNIKAEARRLKRKGGLSLLIVDYLGLIKTNLKFGLRQQEIAHITGELKALAKELDIPVILLSQLSRLPKGTTPREPQLEDLRESGDIEQDAVIVLLLHKPDYYDAEVVDKQGVPWKNRGKIIVAKHREGSRNKTIVFSHDKRYKKIKN